MKNHCHIPLPALILFTAASLITTLSLPVSAQQYSYKLYTVDDGLPTNAVYGGLQDSRGYIWFYTEKGVSRFDGYSFKNFTVKDGLPTNDIFMLSEDSQGRLWPHSFGRRLVYIKEDSVYTVTEDNTPSFNRFPIYQDGKQAWFMDYNRKLLIAEKGQQFDTASLSLINTIQENAVAYPFKWNTFLLIDTLSGKCNLYSGQSKFLGEAQLEGMDIPTAQRLASRRHNSFYTFNHGLLVQPYSDSILYYLDIGRKQARTFNLIDILGDKPDLVRYYELEGQLQVQTNVGAFILDEGLRIVDVFKANLPAAIRIDRIFKDREGNYWIASKQKGVFFLTAEERNTSIILAADQSEDNAITALTGNGAKSLYIGTRRGSVYQLDTNQQLQLLLSTSPSRYNDVVEVKAIVPDQYEGLWIGRQSIGLERHLLRTGQTIPFSSLITQSVIDHGLYEKELSRDAGNGDLHLFVKGLEWSEEQNKLAVARAQFSFLFSPRHSGQSVIQLISTQRAHAVAFGQQGSLWIGQNDGLGYFHNGQYRYFGDSLGLPACNIWDLAVGQNGMLWIGTDGFGLFAFDGKKAVPISGTQDDIIQDVFISSDGLAWIATNRGIKGIAPASPIENSRVIQVLTTNSGLATNEANAVYVDERFIYAGTNEGLAVIDRTLPFRDSTPPRLIWNEIRINNRAVPLSQNFKLSHDQNEIELLFTGISYKSYGKIIYEYQLANAEKEVQHTTNRLARYTGLQPGVYTFRIKAIDINGLANTPLPPIVFTIYPPWWKSRQAIAGWILLAGLILWTAYWLRVRAIRQKAAQKTAINKRFAELELQALQSQMNPHFIFNSLSAIQFFIQSNNKKQAELYLSKFAHLMRLFLESSKNKYISLAEEIGLIRLYVELEQLRFKGKFDFELHTSGEINLHTALLPTMLLQPFVENAINHGLFHKEGKGHLKMSVAPSINGGLKIVVEDDGIGRKRAMEIRQQSDKNYKSRALQIINERLQTLKEVEDYFLNISIEDLFDENGHPAGTKVDIEIPEIE